MFTIILIFTKKNFSKLFDFKIVLSHLLSERNMSNIMYECRACLCFYDGAAQCCPDMYHVAYWVDERGHRTRQVNWDKDFGSLGEDFDDNSFDRIDVIDEAS